MPFVFATSHKYVKTSMTKNILNVSRRRCQKWNMRRSLMTDVGLVKSNDAASSNL